MNLLEAAEGRLLALLQHSPAFIGKGHKRSATLEACSRLISVDRVQHSEEEIKKSKHWDSIADPGS